MPQRVVTLLFTDIEGSTKLWEAFGEGMRRALSKHDAIIKRAVEGHGGSVFKAVGDGFFCAFAAPDAAVAAAIELQKSIHKATWQVPNLRVRCAIHTGTVDSRGGDFFGIALSRTARMLAASYGGQTLLSESSKALIERSLPDGAWLYDHGPQKLKDLETAEHLYEMRHRDIPAEVMGLRSLNELPNNLPEQVTSFVGRGDLIDQIKGSLGRSRLVTLSGSGGSGKTRLSLRVATEVLSDYTGGVWLVELGPVTDASLVVKAVASVLNVREQAGSSLQDALLEFAEQRTMLIILDNCEHLIDECIRLVDVLLKECPNLTLMVTSRESLGIFGELNFRVPSLVVPPADGAPEEIFAAESTRLFVERAQLADPSFVPTPASARSIARIVARLDGIPLAIELAAARVSTMPTDALSARLDESFRILTGGNKAALPRQQTLHAMIDWSFNLLSPPEQAMVRRLSVFSGGWTLETAESVCADGEVIERDDILHLLVQLVGKSLVLYDEMSARYRLLETVRWYSRQKLAETSDAAATRDRHLRAFLTVAENAKLTGANQVEALERLEIEHENLLSALDWCDVSPSGAELALRMVGALGRFWYMHGHFSSGRRALSLALARVDAQARTPRRAEALVAAALLARVQGDLGAAEGFLMEAQVVYRGLDDKRGLSTALNALGNVMREGGRHEDAQRIWEEALLLRVEMGDRAGISVVKGNLGIIAMLKGDYVEAESQIQASLGEERALQRRSHEGIALSNLGLLKLWQGELEVAREYCLLALAVNREVGTKLVESRDLHHLGQIEVGIGTLEQAKNYLVASLRISKSLAAKELMADAIETTAAVMNRERRFEIASTLIGAAERIRHESGCAMPPNEVERYESEVSAVKAALGARESELHIEKGRSMRSAEAVELTLRSLAAHFDLQPAN
ncbi:MAG: adenylate/guanylate cyclase domain-containing protein [Armatimonadota bacterium]|nr:adenylate/guanylate cyclase domain-containing protein [Armatimonadota bacterium]